MKFLQTPIGYFTDGSIKIDAIVNGLSAELVFAFPAAVVYFKGWVNANISRGA